MSAGRRGVIEGWGLFKGGGCLGIYAVVCTAAALKISPAVGKVYPWGYLERGFTKGPFGGKSVCVWWVRQKQKDKNSRGRGYTKRK